MDKVRALVRASWLEALSYRTRMLFSIIQLLVLVVPLYFVSRALQPMMAESIQDQGGEYFGFLVTGLVASTFARVAVNAFPGELGTAISTGTLEALLGTPTRFVTLMSGLSGYLLTWTAVRGLVLFAAASALGADLFWSRGPLMIVVLALVVLTHLGIGLVAAAMVLAFRTSGPLTTGVMWISNLLGGVYYPTSVIPSWLEHVSTFVPLSYGIRAMRRVLLEPEMAVGAIAGDLAVLVLFTVVLLAISVVVFSYALRYARHAGTLAQY